MTHSLKRIFSLTLALCLCLTLLPSVAMKTEALSPTYSVSSSYKSSSYYTALTNVSLTGNQREDIVNVALSQLGYKEGSYAGDYSGAGNGSYNNYTEYNYWYRNCIASTMPLTSDWCAIFVSWCAVQANIPASILRRSAGAGHGSSYFNIKYYSGSSTLADSTDNDSYFSGYNYTPKKGDLFFKRDWTHVGLVVDVSGDYVITVEGNTKTNGTSTGHGVYSLRRPISDLYFGVPDYSGSSSTPHTCNKGTYMYYEAAHPHYKWYTCSVCGEAWRNTAETTYVSTCETCAPKRTIDSRYSGFYPFVAYPVATSGHISVYDESGAKYSNRYIDAATDFCYILEVYTDGWCKVKYPSSAESSGYFYAYVPISTFITSGSFSSWTTPRDYTAYGRSDLKQEWPGYFGSVTNGSKCLLLETDGYNRQIIYPIDQNGTTYYMMGWVKNDKKIHVSTDCVNLTVGGTDTQTIYLWTSGQYNGSTSVYFGQNDATNYSCTFGSWSNGKLPLTIKAYSSGTSKLTIGVQDSESHAVLNSTDLTVTITAKSYTVSYNANGGSGAPASQTKTHGTALTLSSVKPTRSGHTFLGWSTSSTATSASYSAGGSFTSNADTTLYAVWKQLGVAEYKYVKPNKTAYQIGEKLDLTGFKLTLTYTDGTTNTITDGFSISGFDSSSEGERQFKVTYTDGRNLICVYITYTIENPVVTRKIISFPTKTVYEIGDSLDTTGLKFMLTYADGTSLTLWGAFTTSGFSSTSAGEKEVKVFYNGELVGTFTVTVKAPQSTSAKISIASATAKAGNTVSIAVNLDSNPGIAGATFSVNYDDVLTLESVDDKSVLPGTMIAGQVGTKPYTMLWYGSNDSTKTGCFVILNFRVADNAKEGSYNVSISCSDASNEKGADVTIPSASAVVTVKSARLPGDLNGDGKVSIKDSVRLAQYLAGWSVTIQSGNADVNGDGKISIKDSVRLAQYLAGWNVVLK